MAKTIDRFQAVISGLRRSARLRSMPGHSVVDDAPRALAVMSEGPGRDSLSVIFRDAGWTLAVAGDAASAITSQGNEHFPIILYERELPEKDWRQAVSFFSRLSPRPCVILLSRSCDKNLWDELVRCGGFDLLRTPFERGTVIRTLTAAWSIWHTRIPRGGSEGDAASEKPQAITPFRTA